MSLQGIDADVARVLEVFGVAPEAFLGSGGEARVYALDAGRVLRVCHSGTRRTDVEGRAALLREIARSAGRVPFALSQTLEIREVAGRWVAVEQRLPGRQMAQALDTMTGSRRVGLLRSYLDAADRIGDLHLERPWYGHLREQGAVRAARYHAFLERCAARSLAAAGERFAGIDPAALASALPSPERPALVHLDVFPGNVLEEDGRVTAVLDFGATSLMGDRRLDPLAAVAYLSPHITPNATDEDRRIGREWLAERGYAPLFPAAQRWLAASWAFATDDLGLSAWVQEVLDTAPTDEVPRQDAS